MKEKIRQLEKLLEEGRTYNYNNACKMGQYGYPEIMIEEYTSWKLRTELTLKKIFSENNPILTEYWKHNNYRVLGNGTDQFNRYHQCIIGAIKAGIDTLTIDHTLIITDTEKDTQEINSDIFIVHGHDENLKQEVEIFVNELGLNPIVLHRQADGGQTVIEKFEKNSNVGYAFILITPDDICINKEQKDLPGEEIKYSYRARQNVIFEFGYFVGKLGRNRVCCLFKEGTEIPSDINGLIYKKIRDNVEEVAFSVIKDLRAVGYTLKI